jgi:hypothetical protein
MSQSEKQWLISIQLKQLHTDNPFVEDYYALVCECYGVFFLISFLSVCYTLILAHDVMEMWENIGGFWWFYSLTGHLLYFLMILFSYGAFTLF